MKKTLHLQVHFKPNHQGSLVFKTESMAARINNLCNPLRFIGQMKQLSMAIDSGASQNCSYRLETDKGLVWELGCRFVQEMVSLELWATGFSWEGTAKEFGKSVNRMIEKMGRYRFIWF
jgi:hypothetical protein